MLPIALTGYASQIEPFWLDMHEKSITIPGLPSEFDGTRIAHLTDLHIDHRIPMSYLRRVVEHVNAAKPDVVCVTGDVVNHDIEWIDQSAELLSKIDAPVLVSFGNHDYAPRTARPGPLTIIATPLQIALEAAGCVVLRNATAAIEKNGQKLWFVGIDDLWSDSFSPVDAFAGVERGGVSICMSHNPDSAPHIIPFGAKLILSGHTHGGQLRLPLIGAPILPIVDRQFDQGLFPLDNGCQLYVSRGVGFLLRARFCCRPELPIFNLRCA
ncbi:MAG: metallophosphoesterase [Anaerolineae bacterium]|nr:metallophosphoesterase [Phycisphaerae bacterium]